MIPVATARQMRELDEATIREGVPGLKLMEQAGSAVRTEILKRLGRPAGRGRQAARDDKGERGARAGGSPKSRRPLTAVIVCGKGNNGGDGFVVARLLKKDGYRVKPYLLARAAEVKGDALANLKRCKLARINVVDLGDWELATLERDLAEADVVVDAIFGTGFEGTPQGLAAEVIEAINQCPAPVAAVDIPSGVNATTGEVELAVSAVLTVTMGLPKFGHVYYPGRAYTGELAVAPIGIPEEVVARAGLKTFLLGREDVRAALPFRAPNAHKWSCGHVACISGSTGLTGAATLTSHSALRAGAGLVTLAIPRSLNSIMEVKLTEVMTVPVDETPGGAMAATALDVLRGLAGRADCVAIGPGLSQDEETVKLVRALVPTFGRPCVLDADGINAFAGRAEDLKALGFPLVVTPHVGEASRLFGVKKADIQANLVDFAVTRARQLDAVIVLKGAPTVIAGPSGEAYINPMGNPGLATAGSGDVLTGTIAGFLAQGVPALEAAWCGVYVHAVAGDLLLAEKRHFGYLAGEIADKIPEAIASIVLD